MKQQDAYKLLAAFLILTMVFSIFAFIFISPRSDVTLQTPEQQPQQEKYNPEFWVVDERFGSISDALNITPYGVVTADYIDIESMTPQMIQWALRKKVDLVDYPIVSWTDSLYKSNTSKLYYGHLKDGNNESFLLLSTMSPPKNDFEYVVLPNIYPPILRRQEPGIYGMYNIMGNPVIFAPRQTAEDVLKIIKIINSLNKTTTSYDQYKGLLSEVKPAPYQTINSNVTFANQFYMGVREINGSYERTTAYLNINSSSREKLRQKLKQLEANSTQSGFTHYNITKSGNYTVVKAVSPDLLSVLPKTEEIS